MSRERSPRPRPLATTRSMTEARTKNDQSLSVSFLLLFVCSRLLSKFTKQPEENATEAQLGLGDVRWVLYSYREMPGAAHGLLTFGNPSLDPTCGNNVLEMLSLRVGSLFIPHWELLKMSPKWTPK